MKPILIISVRDLRNSCGVECPVSMNSIHKASLVIVKTRTHFRCIKNRWSETCEDEKVPIYLLNQYILNALEGFTKEQLITMLIDDGEQ